MGVKTETITRPDDILDEGLLVAKRRRYNYIGSGVQAADDPTNDRVNITVTGGGGVHALGGASHSADTLANLNSKISDANVDDSGASRTPSAHAASHQNAGGDPIKLDDLVTPDDNTDLNASLTRHGLLLKLGGGTTNFLRADGVWAAPPGGGGTTGEGHVTLLAPMYNAVIAGTWTITGSGTQYGGYVHNDVADAQNDKLDFYCYLDAATYTIRMLGVTSGTFAKAHIYIDDVEVAIFDLYSGTTTYNVRFADTGNVVAAAGRKKISVKAATRNASATGWALYFSHIVLERE